MTSLALVCGFVTALQGTAQASNPGDRSAATWNMAAGPSRWERAYDLAMTHDVVALQEVPQGLPGVGTGPRAGGHLTTRRSINGVEHYQWQYDGRSPEVHLYILREPTRNLGMITRWAASNVFRIDSVYRDALGVVNYLDQTLFASVHAASGGGNDAGALVRRIAGRAEPDSRLRHWVALGDFNRDPSTIGQLDLPEDANVYHAGRPTHFSGSELDYMVTNVQNENWGSPTVQEDRGSDHWPVRFGTMRAAAEPVDMSLMPMGNLTNEFNDFSYKALLFASLAVIGSVVAKRDTLDFVGSQSSGGGQDPDHEGYDYRIQQLAERVHTTVPHWRPNVVTLIAGLEDLKNGTDADGAPERLGQLIDQIVEDAPGVTVLVATLPWVSNAGLRARIEAFNRRLPDVVDQLQGAGKHVMLISLDHLGIDDVAEDGLHPNEEGSNKIADAFHNGLVEAVTLDWISDRPGTGTGETADSVRTMGLGSSTTFGERSPDGNGYRDKLDEELRELFDPGPGPGRPEPLVDWVGSVRVGTMADRDIEGWPGLKIHEIADKAKCAVKTYQPNLITLIAGGNDVVQNYQMDTAIERLEDLIEQVIIDSPGVTVLVSGLQPFHDAARNARSEAFSAQVPGLVDRLVARGKHVVYADITGLEASDIVTIDGIHPNGPGYHKIADAFAKAAAEAKAKNWIRKANPPAPDATNHPCGLEDRGDGTETGESNPNRLGQGWEDRGVIQSQQFPSNSRFWMVDINKDRKAEFVVVDTDQKFRFWWNGGPSGTNWVPFTQGQNAYTPKAGAVGNMLRFGDVDGDGFPDCMVVYLNGAMDVSTWKADNPSGQRMCMNKYDGEADVFLNGSTGNRLAIASDTKIRFADVTGGGRDDYLLIRADGSVKAWYNKGFQVQNGRKFLEWEVPQNISGPLAEPREIRYADINGDRRADRILITAKGGARAWLNEGPGGSGGTYRDIGKIAGDAEVPSKDVQFADVDGDGKADFLRIGWTGVMHAWLNKLPADYFTTFHP
ncbi:GDSL-type esterase/lipase family protein [Streptosporangium sp. NPDC051023]|uniref:GDSL-type esterase/lipase family protein n=1 Tax=Streptosporangium sp. NPDC051023 TaxID=3155410 RepID=UPI00344E43C6